MDRPEEPEHGQGGDDDQEGGAAPRPVDRWRHNTASGAVAAALALGLQQVFDPERKDTSVGIEQEAPTRPVDPDKLELRFDPLNSQGTVVVMPPPRPMEGDEGQAPGS